MNVHLRSGRGWLPRGGIMNFNLCALAISRFGFPRRYSAIVVPSPPANDHPSSARVPVQEHFYAAPYRCKEYSH